LLDRYIAATGYEKLTSSVRFELEGLLNLRLINKIITNSGFVQRYELEQNKNYWPTVIGKYESEVWELVKQASNFSN
jgi:hypothetical protein